MKPTLTRWIATLLIAGVALTACGGQPAAPAATEAPAAEAPAATEAPAAEATEAPAGTAAPEASGEELTFGIVLVGPINDGGWSQAHYESARYVESQIPGTRFIYVDKVNPADRPNVTVEQVVDELVAQGAQLIITNSDDFKDGTRQAAQNHPDVTFMHVSGDDVLTGMNPPNLGNTMGRMEYGKMMAGCAAALQSESGQISYLGPLINNETRRLVNSAFLGARHCWTEVKGQPADTLKFNVTWIGFWFNIPGVTLDPTQVANDFINAGSDVLISGIDTTEALVEANKSTEAGKTVYAIPYDFKEACSPAPDVCLGVPYFNWVPAYTRIINDVRGGTWEPEWEWFGPEWGDINNVETSGIGFQEGPALTAENKEQLDAFIASLADGSLNLYTGPLNFQDGTAYLADGEVADDQKIWYTTQLLEGIEGQSAPE
jgi:simple sugar transport system substrate-binding protein